MLPASFGLRVLLAILLVALIGCSAFTAAPGTIDNPQNACCECTRFGRRRRRPPKFIEAGTMRWRGTPPGTSTFWSADGRPPIPQLNVLNLATITAAHIQFTGAQTPAAQPR
jgi:hypothetical protein